MYSVESIAAEIVRREGGFVNDPDDPGGATKHGVTLKTLRALGIDVTGDGIIDERDVRALTEEQAIDIYVRHYFQKTGICNLPEPLRASVFDMQVNAGANAVRLLQTLTCAFGLPLKADGQIGPITCASVERAFELAPEHFVDAYGIARRNYYYSLADRRPASRKYARRKDGGKGGWITRAEEFITPRFHFTQEQHQERTAAWD